MTHHCYAYIPTSNWGNAQEDYELVSDYFESEEDTEPSYKLIEDASMTESKCAEVSGLGGEVFSSAEELFHFLHNNTNE